MAGQSRLHRSLIILRHSILVPLMETIQFLSTQHALYTPLGYYATNVSSRLDAGALTRSERGRQPCYAGPTPSDRRPVRLRG